MGDNDEERKRMERRAEREGKRAHRAQEPAELLWCSLCLFGNACRSERTICEMSERQRRRFE